MMVLGLIESDIVPKVVPVAIETQRVHTRCLAAGPTLSANDQFSGKRVSAVGLEGASIQLQGCRIAPFGDCVGMPLPSYFRGSSDFGALPHEPRVPNDELNLNDVGIISANPNSSLCRLVAATVGVTVVSNVNFEIRMSQTGRPARHPIGRNSPLSLGPRCIFGITRAISPPILQNPPSVVFRWYPGQEPALRMVEGFATRSARFAANQSRSDCENDEAQQQSKERITPTAARAHAVPRLT